MRGNPATQRSCQLLGVMNQAANVGIDHHAMRQVCPHAFGASFVHRSTGNIALGEHKRRNEQHHATDNERPARCFVGKHEGVWIILAVNDLHGLSSLEVGEHTFWESVFLHNVTTILRLEVKFGGVEGDATLLELGVLPGGSYRCQLSMLLEVCDV